MTEPLIPLSRLRSIELLTPNVAEAASFYSEAWGLEVVELNGQDVWLRSTGPEHHVLALRGAPAPAMGKLTFAMADRRYVDEAGTRLVKAGLPLLSEPGLAGGAAGGYSVTTCDPEGRVIELLAETLAVPQRMRGDSRPLGITHVVLNTANIDAAAAFWVDVFGFRVSDWSEHQMVFLRCNNYHHTIAFNQTDWASINHVAYEMASVDDFMRGIGRVGHAGVPIGWGPGRHGPGNNTFSYFVDPAGFVCEYTAEVAQVDDATWLPRVWKRVPDLSDTWGTAGPPSPDIRAAMAGVKDEGAFAARPQLQATMACFRRS